MSVQSNIVIVSNDDTTASQIKVDTQSPKESIESLVKYLDKLAAGCGAASVDMQMNRTGGAAATGTVTFSALANNDTATVGTQVFTAKTSGAAGANQFNLGVSDTAAAVNFAAAVNAHASLAGAVSASPAAAITTMTASQYGTAGNMTELAISAHGSVSGAHMTGGVVPTSNVMHAGL